jgi:cytochrome c oxidase assembly protein subunit 15
MSKNFLKAYKILILTTLFLIALGGSVRALNAGLACPDWPLCFGDVIPDFHVQVYFEFIHRVIAGFITIALVVLNYKIIRHPNISKSIKMVAIFSWVLVSIQIVLGGLTVLWQLHEKVVAAHLGLGTAFFACLIWIYTTLNPKLQSEPNQWARYRLPSLFVLCAIFTQIILGGLVASHYAANVCPEFPLCHGEFIPTLSGTIGLHVIHRLGAYTLFVIVMAFAAYVLKTTTDERARKYTYALAAGLLMQIFIGIANVIYSAPPLITVMHLAVGAILLGVAIRFHCLSVIAADKLRLGIGLYSRVSQAKST